MFVFPLTKNSSSIKNNVHLFHYKLSNSKKIFWNLTFSKENKVETYILNHMFQSSKMQWPKLLQTILIKTDWNYEIFFYCRIQWIIDFWWFKNVMATKDLTLAWFFVFDLKFDCDLIAWKIRHFVEHVSKISSAIGR